MGQRMKGHANRAARFHGVTHRRAERDRARAASGRQWDDFRCYRCGRWQPARAGREAVIQSSIGQLTVRVCDPPCIHEEGDE